MHIWFSSMYILNIHGDASLSLYFSKGCHWPNLATAGRPMRQFWTGRGDFSVTDMPCKNAPWVCWLTWKMREDETKYICIYRHNIQCTYATVYRHIKRQTFWWGDHSCPFLVESVSNKVMQVGNYPGFYGMGSRRWWHLPRYSHQKRREDAWKSSIFLFMFFFLMEFCHVFQGRLLSLSCEYFFSACLMKRILESSIFHTTRLLNTSEAKKWQAVSRHSHLWRLRSVVTLLLKLFSGEVKFPGSTKTHGKKGPVWFSKCWSFRTPAPVAFFLWFHTNYLQGSLHPTWFSGCFPWRVCQRKSCKLPVLQTV